MKLPNGRFVRYCGIVTLRQQPDTANGVIFVSLEDVSGVVQVICWKSIREEQRQELLNSRLLAVYGKWQREGGLVQPHRGQARGPDTAAGRSRDDEQRLSLIMRSFTLVRVADRIDSTG